MPPTSAMPSNGTLLKMGDGASPENFTTVAEVISSPVPDMKGKKEDATSQDSAGWAENLITLLDGGSIPVKVNWLPSNATQDNVTGVLAAFLNKTKKNWKVVLPNTLKTFSFAATISQWKGDAPVDGKAVAEFTLEISGAVTVA